MRNKNLLNGMNESDYIMLLIKIKNIKTDTAKNIKFDIGNGLVNLTKYIESSLKNNTTQFINIRQISNEIDDILKVKK
jgi:hypothetical protein